jgi:hypothetical protein
MRNRPVYFAYQLKKALKVCFMIRNFFHLLIRDKQFLVRIVRNI